MLSLILIVGVIFLPFFGGAVLFVKKKETAAKIAAGLTLLTLWALINVPGYFDVREKVLFENAARWVTIVSDAEDRYFVKNGHYSTSLEQLDSRIKPLEKFDLVGIALSTGTARGWSLTLRREPLFGNHCPFRYGCYSATYTSPTKRSGPPAGLPGTFACSNTDCEQDLLPQ